MKLKHHLPNPDLENIMPLLIGIWRRFHKEAGPSDKLQTREFRSVVSAIEEIQNGLGNSKNFIGKDYFSDEKILYSYLLYQWVIHYQQGLSLINELPTTPKRVIDICSGPGAFAFAALRHGCQEVYATDRNLDALRLGSEVCGRYGMPITIRQWQCPKSPFPITEKFDLIILGHCLEELFPSNQAGWKERQQEFIDDLIHRLSPKGYLLIVENSFLDANRRVLELRDRLVEKGVPVQAPCIWKGSCPALQTKDSPCYAQRELDKPALIKEIQRSAKINLSSLKMTYIIFRNPKSEWPEIPNKKLYRVISPPVETFHGKRYYLCGMDGKKNLGSHFETQPKEARAFDYLKRGELISIQNSLEKNNALDIVEDTQVKVEAACGKPLPQIEETF